MTEKAWFYEKTFRLGTSECDLNGAWRLGTLLEALQDTANEHGKEQHLWFTEMKEKNATWVLYHTELAIDRVPLLGESIRIQSFSKRPRAMFCPRYYRLLDEQGQSVARAGALLMLMDLTTRRAVMPASLGVEIPDAPDLEPTIKIPMLTPTLEGETDSCVYLPQYTDYDVNGHVNNVRYADWLCNMLGTQLLQECEISAVSIEYGREITRGEPVELVLTRREMQFLCTGFFDGKRAFGIYGQMRLRNCRQ